LLRRKERDSKKKLSRYLPKNATLARGESTTLPKGGLLVEKTEQELRLIVKEKVHQGGDSEKQLSAGRLGSKAYSVALTVKGRTPEEQGVRGDDLSEKPLNNETRSSFGGAVQVSGCATRKGKAEGQGKLRISRMCQKRTRGGKMSRRESDRQHEENKKMTHQTKLSGSQGV